MPCGGSANRVLELVVCAFGISSLAANPIRRRKVHWDMNGSVRVLLAEDEEFLALSRKEFGVLEVLLRADGAVISTEDLIEQVWEENTSYRTNAVRITISNLRSKLGDQALIETLPGQGYRIAAGPGRKR